MWADDLVKELDSNVPKDAITVAELAKRTGKSHQITGHILLTKWRQGELERRRKGKEFYYWPKGK